MDTFTEVKAEEVIKMFESDLESAIIMTHGASMVHVVVGWLPPRNSHTNIVKIHDHTFGLGVNQRTKLSADRLLEQVGLGKVLDQPVITSAVELGEGLHVGYAIEGDVVVVCVSDSETFTFDFCARLAENIKDVSEAALSS